MGIFEILVLVVSGMTSANALGPSSLSGSRLRDTFPLRVQNLCLPSPEALVTTLSQLQSPQPATPSVDNNGNQQTPPVQDRQTPRVQDRQPQSRPRGGTEQIPDICKGPDPPPTCPNNR
jgi:hypothetical protein